MKLKNLTHSKRLQCQKSLKNFEQRMCREVQTILGEKIPSESFFVADICSTFCLKLQYKISGSVILILGMLIYSNGETAAIPLKYRNLLLGILHQSNQIHVRFQYINEIQCLVVKSGIKFNPITGARSEEISACVSRISQTMSTLKQALHMLGMDSKFSRKSFEIKKSRLILMRKVAELANNSKDILSPITTKDSQPENTLKKGCVFKLCRKIVNLPGPQQFFQSDCLKSDSNFKVGGYFQIEKKICKIEQLSANYAKQKPEVKVAELAVKTLKKMRKNSACSDKIKKQYRILKEIVDNRYFLSYYLKNAQIQQIQEKREMKNGIQNSKRFKLTSDSKLGKVYQEIMEKTSEAQINFHEICEKNGEEIYMNYIEETLDDNIHGKDHTIFNILDFSQQIVNGVMVLQQSGIAHRDLKPDNILVQRREDRSFLKIIDFGESTLFADQFDSRPEFALGSTLPYSPIECSLTTKQGFNSEQIDLWSIGIIIYELLHKTNPLYYSRCFSSDIYRGWNTADQFSVFASIRKKRGVQIVENMLVILAINSICINQRERIGLVKMKKILESISQFLTAFQ